MSGITKLIKRVTGQNNRQRDYYDPARTSYWDKPEVFYCFENDVDTALRAIYYEAIAVWQGVMNPLGVRLTETTDPGTADVLLQGWRATSEPRFGKTVIWNRDMPGHEPGRTPSGIRIRCVIELNAARREQGMDKTRAVILHEWAHVLGIDGTLHSPDKGDIMHATTYVTALSDADRRTMERIYKEKQ